MRAILPVAAAMLSFSLAGCSSDSHDPPNGCHAFPGQTSVAGVVCTGPGDATATTATACASRTWGVVVLLGGPSGPGAEQAHVTVQDATGATLFDRDYTLADIGRQGQQMPSRDVHGREPLTLAVASSFPAINTVHATVGCRG